MSGPPSGRLMSSTFELAAGSPQGPLVALNGPETCRRPCQLTGSKRTLNKVQSRYERLQRVCIAPLPGDAYGQGIGGEGRTHGADNRTTAFEFYDFHVGLCRSANRLL